MSSKIKIAIITVDLSMTGISTVIMNYCTYINKQEFALEILAGNRIEPAYQKQCDELGINIVKLPFKIEEPKQYYIALYKKISKRKYDIVHVHGNSTTMTIELFIAWMKGIKIRIAHCHNTTCSHLKVHKLLKPFFRMLYTEGFACSTLAGRWLFGRKKFYVIFNGFNTERFKFDGNLRNVTRKKLGLQNKFVLGHIGCFNDQKNHRFLLEIFEQIATKRSDAHLLLVGNGPKFNEIKNLIDDYKFKDKVLLYGKTEETESMYDAMDVFVFPSKYEGLGIVLLEAQISGLACVSSDVVPREVKIGQNLFLISLKEKASDWAKIILDIYQNNREEYYQNNLKKIMKYDIEKNVIYIENLYRMFYDEVSK